MARTSASIAFVGQSHAALSDECALESRLHAVVAGIDRTDIVVCTCVDGEIAFAAAGPAREARRSDAPVRPGCLTKLFTATLIGQLITEGAMGLEQLAGTLIPISRSVSECLDGVTIRHLLDHTHGLDDSACIHAPRAPDGFIDSEVLIRSCSEFRLNRPGEIYSYSNAGTWIAGAILEAWHDCRYEEILQARLFDPLGITPEVIAADELKTAEVGLCPATGGAIAISARDLARFLDSGGSRKELWPDPAVASAITPLPGWNPFERGVYRGWKFFGDGWYGHNSIADDGSTVMARLHPEERISVVVSSTHPHANVVAARLFGKALPGYSTLCIPKLTSPEAVDPLILQTCAGTYSNSRDAFSVTALGSGMIELESQSGRSVLNPASDHVFIARGADARGVKFIQFLRRHGSSFRYLWDGRRLYKNVKVGVHD